MQQSHPRGGTRWGAGLGTGVDPKLPPDRQDLPTCGKVPLWLLGIGICRSLQDTLLKWTLGNRLLSQEPAGSCQQVGRDPEREALPSWSFRAERRQ